MTVSFPEIVEAFAGFEEPLVLDGEILAWKEDRALPFSSLPGPLGTQEGHGRDASGHAGGLYGV